MYAFRSILVIAIILACGNNGQCENKIDGSMACSAYADDISRLPIRTKQIQHCGIASVYTILKLAGEEVDIDDIISAVSPEVFIEGMGIDQLEELLDKYRINHARFYGRSKSIDEYLKKGCHVIVPNDATRHLLVYISQNETKYLRFDPPHKADWVAKDTLESDWYGLGIVVSNKPIVISNNSAFRLIPKSNLSRTSIFLSIIIFTVAVSLKLPAKARLPLIILIALTEVCLAIYIYQPNSDNYRVTGGHIQSTDSLLKLSPTELNLGEVPEGKSAKGEIKIHNISKQIVHIKSIDADCGCIVPDINKHEFEPDDLSKLDISLETHGLSGETIKYLSIVGEDELGRSQRVILPIKADVLTKFELSPKYLKFSEILPGQMYHEKLLLRSKLYPDLEITGAEILSNSSGHQNPAIEIEWEKIDDAYELSFAFEQKPEGPSQGSVFCKIKTNKEDLSDVGVWLLWERKEEFAFEPKSIVVYSNGGTTEHIKITKKTPDIDFSGVSLRTDMKGLGIQLQEKNKDSLSYKISIDSCEFSDNFRRGEIKIVRSGNNYPLYKIPVLLIRP